MKGAAVLHSCPSCRSLVPIVRVGGAWLAQCPRCGSQAWRAVLPVSDPVVLYDCNREYRGRRRTARPGRRAVRLFDDSLCHDRNTDLFSMAFGIICRAAEFRGASAAFPLLHFFCCCERNAWARARASAFCPEVRSFS